MTMMTLKPIRKTRRKAVYNDERSFHKLTPRFLAAVEALQDLEKEEGYSAAQSAYAAALAAEHELRVTEGLKPSRKFECISALKGNGACDMHYMDGRHVRGPCAPPAGDHVTMWDRDGEPYLYISEPYDISWKQLQELVAFGQEHALEVSINAYDAFHNPGKTLSVKLHRAVPKG